KELVAGADLADQPGALGVDEPPADTGGDQALVVETAEGIFLITQPAVPEIVLEEVEAALGAGLPPPRGGVAVVAHIEPAQTEAPLHPVVLVGGVDPRVGGAAVAVAPGKGQSGLTLAGPSRRRRQGGEQQQAG